MATASSGRERRGGNIRLARATARMISPPGMMIAVINTKASFIAPHLAETNASEDLSKPNRETLQDASNRRSNLAEFRNDRATRI